MGFIENWRNGLTRWLDRGKNNVQHASEFSDEQKQKWNDERADNFLENYRKEYDKLKIRNGKNGDEGYWEQNAYQDMEGLSPKALQENASPYVYEFSYLAPANGNSIDDGEMVEKTGLVYMLTNKLDGEIDSRYGKPTGGHYVYEAVLDDGTTLSGKEFQDFVTANSAVRGGSGFKLKNRSLYDNPSDFAGSDNNKKKALEFYNQKKGEYVVDPVIGRNPYRKYPYWDKQKRMWVAR